MTLQEKKEQEASKRQKEIEEQAERDQKLQQAEEDWIKLTQTLTEDETNKYTVDIQNLIMVHGLQHLNQRTLLGYFNDKYQLELEKLTPPMVNLYHKIKSNLICAQQAIGVYVPMATGNEPSTSAIPDYVPTPIIKNLSTTKETDVANSSAEILPAEGRTDVNIPEILEILIDESTSATDLLPLATPPDSEHNSTPKDSLKSSKEKGMMTKPTVPAEDKPAKQRNNAITETARKLADSSSTKSSSTTSASSSATSTQGQSVVGSDDNKNSNETVRGKHTRKGIPPTTLHLTSTQNRSINESVDDVTKKLVYGGVPPSGRQPQLTTTPEHDPTLPPPKKRVASNDMNKLPPVLPRPEKTSLPLPRGKSITSPEEDRQLHQLLW